MSAILGNQTVCRPVRNSARLPSLPLRLVVPDAADIVSAAKLKSKYRISYADAFAATLAARDSAALVTGNPELRALIETVPVEWIGTL